MHPEMPGNKYFSSFGQLWVIQSPPKPNGEYFRKILESTDHTLVPMHYKQLAGEVWPVTCPQFQKEEVCRLATMSTSIQAQNTCFFYQCGKIASLFTSLQAWLKSNAAAKLQMKRKIPVLNWSWPNQAQSTLRLFFWLSADTAQGIKHCQRQYGPRCWLLWPIFIFCICGFCSNRILPYFPLSVRSSHAWHLPFLTYIKA